MLYRLEGELEKHAFRVRKVIQIELLLGAFVNYKVYRLLVTKTSIDYTYILTIQMTRDEKQSVSMRPVHVDGIFA